MTAVEIQYDRAPALHRLCKATSLTLIPPCSTFTLLLGTHESVHLSGWHTKRNMYTSF